MAVTKYLGGSLAIAGGGLIFISVLTNPLYIALLEIGGLAAILNLIFSSIAILGGVLVISGKYAGAGLALAIGIVFLVFGILTIMDPSMASEIMPFNYLYWELGLELTSPLWYFPIEIFLILGGGIFGLFGREK
ncbi:MAG: hypothetical protein ACTSQ8_09860 [Candidatus Helarchaeota archaeon]